MNNDDRTDLERLIEAIEHKTWGYRWAKLRLDLNEWWHARPLRERVHDWIGIAFIMALISGILMWANNIGIERMGP